MFNFLNNKGIIIFILLKIKIMEQLNFEEIKGKIEQFTDLKELPYLCDLIEINGRKLERGEYMRLHKDIIPETINKLWFNGLLLNGKPMESIIYDKIEPELRGFLTEKGIDSQECFLSIEPGIYNEEYPDDWELVFYMGFDVFGDDKGECGWAIFKFVINNAGYLSFYKSTFQETNMQPYERGFGLEWDKYSNYGDIISYHINREGKTFYSYKTPLPYKGLYDYFSDGGYILRLD